MKEFYSINNPNIVKKNVTTVKAKERQEFSRFLPPEEVVTVCNCLLETKGGRILVTGVQYPMLSWEHVLVRAEGRCPTYREMISSKELFWDEGEIAFQVYPAKSQYVNKEEYTLHLWRDTHFSEYEYLLKDVISCCYTKAKNLHRQNGKNFFVEDDFGKRLLVFGSMCWPSWKEISEIKQKFWNTEAPAIQYHLSQKLDDNPEYVMMLWDANGLRLPQVEIV